MATRSIEYLAPKFCALHGLPYRKRRQIYSLHESLPGDDRAALRAALERDLRDGKLDKNATHLARFLAARGM